MPGLKTRKYKLIIAYDGSAYQGWQWQKTGLGVQQKVEEALAHYFPSAPRLHSSSRTDRGVHALGMAAHFGIPLTDGKLPAARLALALNHFLPDDIRVLGAARAPEKFHARFNATGKQYRYFIWNHPVMNPLLRGRAWHVPVKLDWDKMRAAAKLLVGRHDFKSFSAAHSYEVKNTVRTLTRCSLRKSGANLTVTLEGDGFLYKMCRCIVGTLVQVGQGKFSPDDIQTLLARAEHRVAGMNAPAMGLVLWQVFYKRLKAEVTK